MGSYRLDRFDAPNNFINVNQIREDRVLRLRSTAGVPLANMLGKTNAPTWLGGSLVLFGLELVHFGSSLPNFDYYDTKFSATLNKR